MYKQQGLTLIETTISFMLVSVCAGLLLSTFVHLSTNQLSMIKQNRGLNIAQKAIAEAWNSGRCDEAKTLALDEGMTLRCAKVSYGAHIELEWHSSQRRVQRIEIN